MNQAVPTLGTKTNTLQVPRLTGLVYFLIAAIFIVFSFWNGLYFDKSFMSAAIYLSIIVIGFLVWIVRSRMKISGFIIADYLVFSYFGVYFLSALLPVNTEYAVLGFVRGLCYLFLYLLIRIVTSFDGRKHILLNGLILSGVVFGLYGLANGFGSLNVNGAIFDPQMRRLAANFEYSNTYAIYQAIIFLLSVVMASLEREKLKKILYTISGYILLVSMILTYSRGTWLVLAGMLLLLLILSPKGNKGQIALQTINPVLVLLVTISLLSKATLNSNGMLGWSTLAIGVVGVGVLVWSMSTLSNRLSARQWKVGLIGTGIALIVGIGLVILKIGLPQNLVQRFESINIEQFSVVQRFVFYKDGLKVLSEHPIIGAGPNAWPALYQRYQSYPYVSRQSHSFLMDTIMSVGVLGTLVFAAALVAVIWTSIRFYRTQNTQNRIVGSAILCSLIGLIAHGAIDFDFSYGTINFLMWTLVALLLPNIKVEQGSVLSAKIQTSPYQKPLLYTGMIVMVASGLIAGGYLVSNQYLAEASASGKAPEAALTAAQNATAMAPYRASLWLTRARYEELIYNLKKGSDMPPKIKASAERAVALAPHDPEILREAAGVLGKYGGGLQTIEVTKQAWENGRYQIQYPEQYVIFTDIAGTELYQNDKSKSKEYFIHSLETYHDVEQRIADFKNLPPVLRLEYKYDITSAMRLNAGESAYYLGQYDEAKRVLEPMLISGNPKEQGKAKAIIAAIEGKQGKPIDASLITVINHDKELNQYYTYLSQIEPIK